MSLECSELLEHFLWQNGAAIDQRAADRREAIQHEMADVAIYLLELASVLEIDLGEAILAKLSSTRALPGGEGRGNSRSIPSSRATEATAAGAGARAETMVEIGSGTVGTESTRARRIPAHVGGHLGQQVPLGQGPVDPLAASLNAEASPRIMPALFVGRVQAQIRSSMFVGSRSEVPRDDHFAPSPVSTATQPTTLLMAAEPVVPQPVPPERSAADATRKAVFLVQDAVRGGSGGLSLWRARSRWLV